LAAAREVRRDTVGGEAIAPPLIVSNDDGTERCPEHDAEEPLLLPGIASTLQGRGSPERSGPTDGRAGSNARALALVFPQTASMEAMDRSN
jgi:hypothetical protein